ncbi:Uncharacterised protein [Candidatus Anstonella stagnisolia]|nr:Uncharacterised protein [Candidatus Anstonella stagnisolia]
MRLKATKRGAHAIGCTRGQASMEALTLLGFVVLFFVPLALLFFATSQNRTDEAAIMQARLAGRQIADNAGEVYLQGTGARRETLVNFPSNLLDVQINGTQIVFMLSSAKGRTDIVTQSFAPLMDGKGADGNNSLHSMQTAAGKINSGNRKIVFSTVQKNASSIVVEISHG